MGFIEPLAMATALPSGVLPLGSSLLLTALLVGALGVALTGIIWSALPRGPRLLRTPRLVHSTAA
jgi:hypothetical protein